MMSQARPFKIPSAMFFSLNLLEDIKCQRIRSNGWTSHPIYGQVGWIVVGEDNWCPL